MTLGPLMIDLRGEELAADERETLANPLVGGVILFRRNYRDPAQLRRLVGQIRAARRPGPLIAVDQEGGRIQRFCEGFYRIPAAHWLGRQHDLDEAHGRRLAYLCGWVMAAELVASGVDFSFAPVVDLDWGISEIIGDRAFHRDPEVVASLALSYMHGMRKAGMAAVAKHFPGHGAVIADSHLELPEDPRTYEDLRDDLAPYQTLIGNGLAGVMAAHVRYPGIDPDVASLSRAWLRDELRVNLGFQGAIFSDDLSMAALDDQGPMEVRAERALAAGADMVLVCNRPDTIPAVLEALAGYASPVGQGRLAAMRAQPALRSPETLHESEEWQAAVAALTQAAARPVLALDG